MASAEVTSVPQMNGTAPNSRCGTSQALLVRKDRPNLWIDGSDALAMKTTSSPASARTASAAPPVEAPNSRSPRRSRRCSGRRGRGGRASGGAGGLAEVDIGSPVRERGLALLQRVHLLL